MLKDFPYFEKLSPDQKEEIDSTLSMYPPHSDFNFVGLYDYDVNNDKMVCRMKEGLAFILNDYLAHNKFLSFIGRKDIDKKIFLLLEYSKRIFNTDTLKLIPEIVVRNIKTTEDFDVEEDPNNFDYIINVQDLIDLKGRKWHGFKKEVKHFITKYTYEFRLLNLNDPNIQEEMRQLFFQWAKQNHKEEEDVRDEIIATQRHIVFATHPDCISFGLYVDNKMIGYSMNQLIHSGYYIGHFGKTDNNFRGASRGMEYECAKFLKQKGYSFMNIEQDLGLKGLRQLKRSLNPTGYIKKYDIRPKKVVQKTTDIVE